VYLLCRFFAINHQAILDAGLVIPNEVFAYGALREPLFMLISEFESRAMRFYMRERRRAKFFARMIAIETKYAAFPFIACHAQLLRLGVFLRFGKQNRNLSLLADALTWEAKVSGSPDLIQSDLSELSMEKALEQVLDDRAIARVADGLDDGDDSSLEEEDGDEGELTEPKFPIEFDQDTLVRTLDGLRAEVDRRKTDDDIRGIYSIGSELIRDYGLRSGWNDGLIGKCFEQFARWIQLPADDETFVLVSHLPQFLFWGSLGTSTLWAALKDYADLIISLPAAETENERVFSVRKHVIGDRNGRSKNDLVTARVRTRMERCRDKSGATL
jgi:hypothetical protein